MHLPPHPDQQTLRKYRHSYREKKDDNCTRYRWSGWGWIDGQWELLSLASEWGVAHRKALQRRPTTTTEVKVVPYDPKPTENDKRGGKCT